MKSCRGLFAVAVFCLGIVLAVGVPAAYADDVTLTHLNSIFVIDPHTSTGAFTWSVDGIDHLFQQSFWFRLGAAGGESNISTIFTAHTTFLGTRGLSITYTHASFSAEVLYTLTGGALGSGASDVAETISITNTSGSPLSFHFFQYSDFDLAGTIGGDTVRLVNPNVWEQTDLPVVLSETSAIPTATRCESAVFPFTRTHLGNATPSTLAHPNVVGSPCEIPLGPTDATWAWQWDFTLNPRGTFQVSKDKRLTGGVVVPEPASALLFGSGLLSLAWACRRRRGFARSVALVNG